MLEHAPTLLAALVGAVIGSIGAVFAEQWLIRRSEESRRRETLVQRYLFQLQDAAEALWHRLNNLTFANGRYVMPDDYFETTTMYALGRVLAVERTLALDGAYPQLDLAYPAIERGDPVPRRVQFNLDMARIEAEELRTWGNRELTRQIREQHEPQHFSGSRCTYPGPGVGFC